MKGDYEVKPKKVYAGYNVNQDARLSSSSGAVFSLLAGRSTAPIRFLILFQDWKSLYLFVIIMIH